MFSDKIRSFPQRSDYSMSRTEVRVSRRMSSILFQYLFQFLSYFTTGFPGLMLKFYKGFDNKVVKRVITYRTSRRVSIELTPPVLINSHI